MALSNLSTTSKISLLSVLIVIAVIAVVIPFLVLRGSTSTSTKTTNITNITTDSNIEVLKSIKSELESLKFELKSSLEKADRPPENTNAETIPMNVNVTGRRKRQALTETTTTTTTVKVTKDTPIIVTEGSVGQSNQNVSPTTVLAETWQARSDKKDDNKTVEEAVDDIIGVLDMVQKIREDIEKGIAKLGDRGSELSSKLHAETVNIKDILMSTPAEKQLARELLTRIEKDEEDINNTIRVLEDGQTFNPGERKQQVIVTKLTAVYTSMMKVEIMLQSQINITDTPREDISTISTTNNTNNADHTTSENTTDNTATNVTNTSGQTNLTSQALLSQLDHLLENLANISNEILKIKDNIADDTISDIDKAEVGLGKILLITLVEPDKAEVERLLTKVQDTKRNISLAVHTLQTKKK